MPSITAQPLTHCPVCNYDLTGLPKNHRCPECGFEYDETMLVWYGRKPSWRLILPNAIGLALVPWVICSLVWYEKHGSLLVPGSALARLPRSASLLFIGFGVLGFLLGFALHSIRHRPGLLVLSDDALYLRSPFRRIRRISWRELDVRGWMTVQLDAENEAGRRIPGNHTYKWRQRLVRYGLLGSGLEFRVAMKLFGAFDPTIQLGAFYNNSAAKDDVQRAVYDRWKCFQESQPADSESTNQNPER